MPVLSWILSLAAFVCASVTIMFTPTAKRTAGAYKAAEADSKQVADSTLVLLLAAPGKPVDTHIREDNSKLVVVSWHHQIVLAALATALFYYELGSLWPAL